MKRGIIVSLILVVSLWGLPQSVSAQVGVAKPELIQNEPTQGARDWEFFTRGGNDHYLALANAYNDSTSSINAKLFQWDGSNFVEIYTIPTTYAHDWEFFTINQKQYLAVANYWDSDPPSTKKVDSKIFEVFYATYLRLS